MNASMTYETGFDDLIGESSAMHDLKDRMLRVKDVNATVLILGESGTGKEVVAKCLHDISPRKSNKFCAINCGAIPENLLESELFGHRRGAFTDAKSDKKGLFEVVGSGTLLLDEIGDMPLLLQTKLLRVLQEKHFTPLGCSEPVQFNARVLCATNRNLVKDVQEGRFRQDLFFRINVVILNTPALRNRSQDIPLLVSHFTDLFNQRHGRDVRKPDQGLMKSLAECSWPGNVRELQNSVERAVVLAPDDEMQRCDLFCTLESDEVPFAFLEHSSGTLRSNVHLDMDKPLTVAKDDFEKAYLMHQLESVKGNVSDASRKMGRYRADVYRMIEKHGLNVQEFRLKSNIFEFDPLH